MPHVPLRFQPGFRADDTELSSKAGFVTGDRVRWRRGELQPIGGFARASLESFTGIARIARAWAALDASKHAAWGTNAKLYAYPGGLVTDITPVDAPTPGGVDGVGGGGYGSGTYGAGTYGGGTDATTPAQTWCLGNFGERLLALFCGGKLYEWKPVAAETESVANGDFASGAGWTVGSGWSIGSDVATATAGVASNLSRTLSPAPEGGTVYRFKAAVTRSAGSLFIRLGTVDIHLDDALAPIPINATGAVDFLFLAPAGETVLNIYKDAAFAGTVDNVSIRNEAKAYAIGTAPERSLAMFVESHGHVILLGTVEVDGDFNALALRWCGQGNVRDWVPDTDSTAGELVTQAGSRFVGGLSTRGQSLVFTDTSVLALQYIGETTNMFGLDEIASACGLISPHAAVDVDGAAIWMTNSRQFFVCNGQSATAIECPVAREVFDNLAPGQDAKITSWYNAEFGEIWWHYADKRDGQEVSRYVAFNPAEKYWHLGTFDRSAWTPAGIFPTPMGFGTDGAIYLHETGSSAAGDPLLPWAETGAFDIAEGTHLAAISRIIPDFKGLPAAGLHIQIYARPMSQAPWRLAKSCPVLPTTQSIPVRVMARQIKFRFEWTDYEATGRGGHLVADVMETGARR